MIAVACPLVAAGLAVLAGWWDARTGRIPDALTLPVAGLAVALHAVAGGIGGALGALAGALLVGLVPLLLHRRDALGGGDVKLFAALGALLGIGPGLEIQFVAFAVGALIGIVLWWRRGELGVGLRGTLVLALPVLARRWPAPARLELRFGPAIAVATVLVLAWRATGGRP